MVLYIKNMVCGRCIAAVKSLLDTQGLPYTSVQLGEVELQNEPTAGQLSLLKEGFQQQGFELLDDSRKQLIEKIKTFVIEYVHHGAGDQRYAFSHLLAAKMGKDYSYLSHLFSAVEGTTIE